MNKTISYAKNLCYLIYGLNIIIFVIFLGAMTYSLIQPQALDNVIITDSVKSGVGFGNVKICSACSVEGDVLLSDINTFSKLWLLARGSAFFLILFLVVNRILRILRSVASREAFYGGNIQNFKKMATYGFIATVISTFNFFYLHGIAQWHFTLPLAPLSFAIGCLVLAEVFKEGESLVEDKESII
ncbi:DUF2975 domain-containing protein [Roseivirga sp. E12]|uniref:DUF2975 domain-containing protein n=1 Tax=Roseivirga sp. E12 TaxID=2819237 RepID=UPI001ABC54A5|nr:DUF2975 domain-containing protein [Roseivirga sp. E12]MBO3697752.1 hypothetical protein [Roseivirga sp. E12]